MLTTNQLLDIEKYLSENEIVFDYLTIEKDKIHYHKMDNSEGSLRDPVETEPKGEASNK